MFRSLPVLQRRVIYSFFSARYAILSIFTFLIWPQIRTYLTDIRKTVVIGPRMKSNFYT